MLSRCSRKGSRILQRVFSSMPAYAEEVRGFYVRPRGACLLPDVAILMFICSCLQMTSEAPKIRQPFSYEPPGRNHLFVPGM